MLSFVSRVRPSAGGARLGVLALLLLALALPLVPAGAQAPPVTINQTIPASGSFEFDNSTSRFTYGFTFGPTFIGERRVQGTISGTMAGTVDTSEKVVSRDPSLLLTNYTFKSTQICTCTVAGRRGVFTLSLEGHGDDVSFSGTYEVVGRGSGDLANLRGFGTLVGHPATTFNSPVQNGYSGVFFFVQ
jgi:hypothetical protein